VQVDEVTGPAAVASTPERGAPGSLGQTVSPGPRARIAPSPTGYFHVGNARAALYNWLFVRQQGGTFILRIEDTDVERHVLDAVDSLEDALRWLGLDWDEGPYFQSERSDLYRGAAARLVAGGHAYYCDCTGAALAERNRDNPTPGYDRFCRERGLGPAEGRALRFRVPLDEGPTTVVDLVRGHPSFEHRAIEDFVVVRGNGTPVFILANAVDDIDMAVTHVIRGEEHLPNTPKYLLLWQALEGGPAPVFAHLPMLVNERRQKLSKRRDRVAVGDFRAEGYLPEALVNYLALLGWSPGNDRERLSREELVAEFRLEDVVPSPAFFDLKKLAHVNAVHIRALSPDEFVQRCRPWLPPNWDLEAFAAVAPLVQERVTTLGEVVPMIGFLFVDEPDIDKAAWDKVMAGGTGVALLDGALGAYASCEWTAEELHRVTGELGEAHGLKLKRAQAPVRVAITGSTVGPPLFESLVALGRERTLERLVAARSRLG